MLVTWGWVSLAVVTFAVAVLLIRAWLVMPGRQSDPLDYAIARISAITLAAQYVLFVAFTLYTYFVPSPWVLLNSPLLLWQRASTSRLREIFASRRGPKP
jgi:hypothetical protein